MYIGCIYVCLCDANVGLVTVIVCVSVCVCVRTRVCVWIIQKTVTGYQSNAYSRISMDGFEKEGVGVSARKDYQESIFLVSLYLSLIEQ